MGDERSLDELLRQGGWELDDVQARHRRYPDTFHLPPPDELAALGRGDMARLIFRLVDQADGARDGVPPFSAGSRVAFTTADIIDTATRSEQEMESEVAAMAELEFPLQPLEAAREPVDPHRRREISDEQQAVCDRAGVRPERPLPVSLALASKSLADPASWPIFGVRATPKRERNDTGWSVWSEEPDFDRAADAGIDVIRFGELYERRRAAWSYLALPPGWVFAIYEDGSDLLEFDDELLD